MSMDYSGTPGEYIYSHNATGKSASGIIANGSTSERDLGAQRSAGGADRQAGDQGGHLIADRFGGRNDPTNLDAQAANVNQKDQANVERNVANLAANPNNTVSMNVSNFNSVGERPDATMINVGVQDNTTGAIDEQHISFQNASHEMQQSWNDTANQADQTVDSSQNAGMTDEQIDIANAVRLIFELDMDVHILSSVLDNEYAIKEKKEWLRFWLPWLPECCCHFISYGSVKMPLCREKIAYLLDDYIRNLVHWSGVGIKFCTEYNDSRGSWDGHRIYATDTPPEMAKKILMIMKMDYKGGYGMLQMQSSEITLLERPNVEKNSKAPVIQLAPGFMIDDSILEKPTLLIGQVSSGKSYLLRNAIMPRIFSDMRAQDAAVIFATKREMIDGFYHPENGDLLLEYNACKPECIWNIFAEMEASNDPEKTLVELCDVMFSKHKNTVQPFFTNAPKDMFKSLTMYLYENYELQTGKKPTNSTLIGFFNTVTLKDSVVNDKTRKGLLTLIKEVTRLHHLSDYLGEGGTAQALGVLGELRTVLKETFQGGAFVKPGTFSVRQALREGKKVFLLFNYAESTESSIVFFDMILDQMIKQSLEENDQKVWFFLDEFSLLGHLQYLQSALAYGRSNGFRLIAAVQSVQLLEKNYSESEASCMLGLFPNVFCFFTSDYKSRQLLSNRYGKNLVSVIGYGGGKPELRERSVIQDADFYKIALPGDCIVSLAGYSPFFFRNHRR